MTPIADRVGESLVLLEHNGCVAQVLINRPQRHNALVPALLAELNSVFARLANNAGTAVIVLRAAGRSFSTGGDMQGFADHADAIQDYANTLVTGLNRCIASILDSPVPVLVAVDGQVTGGALGLVLACDIVLVTERASFTPYYTKFGFSPDGGWAAMLPDFIGSGRAMAVQTLNDTISAQQALQWGMAYRMISCERLEDELGKLCDQVMAGKTGSLQATKRLGHRQHWLDRLEQERASFVNTIASDEALRGIREFIDKRGQHR